MSQPNGAAGPQVGKNSLPLQIRLVTSSHDSKYSALTERVETLLVRVKSLPGRENDSLVCNIVTLNDTRNEGQLQLPSVKFPCLLPNEGRSFSCSPDLSREILDRIVHDLDVFVNGEGSSGRVTKEDNPSMETRSNAGAPAPASDFVVYMPEGQTHVQILLCPSSERSREGGVIYRYTKDTVPLWTIHVGHSASESSPGRCSIEVNPDTLNAQFQRMSAGHTHGFSLLVRDFLRNAFALARVNSSGSRKRPLFYPGVFDLAGDVKQHYNVKAGQQLSQSDSQAGSVRVYNNLVKSILLNEWIPRNSYILDLACGHGQDLMKYKGSSPAMLIGVDISGTALAEARRRYASSRVLKYAAQFIEGNLMLPSTFEEIRAIVQASGNTEACPFDIVSMQLALHYVVGSPTDAKTFFSHIAQLLKSGGKFIATLPSSDRIAGRLRTAHPTDEKFTELAFGNNKYRVTLGADEIGKLIPSVSEAVSGKSADAFDASMEQVDWADVSKATKTEWGVKYKFWLVDTIDNQEEFIVPMDSLTELLAELGLVCELDINFAEVLTRAEEKKSQVMVDFKRGARNTELGEEDDEIFKFYKAIVFRKV